MLAACAGKLGVRRGQGARWAHPLVGGISAGAMMQPSAALYNGNEISYRPSLANSGSAIRIGEALMNNRGAGFVQDQFTIHSHFSERGYQGMMPVALVQRVADNLNWAAGFDEGGVGHYYESTGEVFTRGVPDRGTGIALFSDCLGDEHAQQCLTHFVSDGDVWNSRTGEFDMAEGKQLCTGTQAVPEARCAFSSRLSSVSRLSHPRPIPAPISPLARALCPSVFLPSPSLSLSLSSPG